MHGAALLDDLRRRGDAMLSGLRDLVAQESPSRDKAALDALAVSLSSRFRGLGASVERLLNPDGGDHLLARLQIGDSDARDEIKPALVLGHFDTVWPLGTIAARPFVVDGDRAYGPGAYDMKASLILIAEALRAIRDLRLPLPRPVTVLLTSDEEIGSPTSRELIERTALASEYVLVVEPPMSDGALKTARKGVGKFRVAVTGRSAHAGVEPEKGINAILELAHQTVRLHAMNRPDVGTTVNVGWVGGGTTSNVVPALARAKVDVRVASVAEAHRIEAEIRALTPVLRGARIAIDGHFDRPPMERSPAIASLFQRARAIGRTIGLDLTEGSTGGGSDGNLTAAAGVPTLDGLGAMGGGAHAENEHVLLSSLPERSALLALLLLSL